MQEFFTMFLREYAAELDQYLRAFIVVLSPIFGWCIAATTWGLMTLWTVKYQTAVLVVGICTLRYARLNWLDTKRRRKEDEPRIDVHVLDRENGDGRPLKILVRNRSNRAAVIESRYWIEKGQYKRQQAGSVILPHDPRNSHRLPIRIEHEQHILVRLKMPDDQLSATTEVGVVDGDNRCWPAQDSELNAIKTEQLGLSL